jgi:hypothetical protein
VAFAPAGVIEPQEYESPAVALRTPAGFVSFPSYPCADVVPKSSNKAAHPTAGSVFHGFVAPFSPWMASAF